MLIEFGLKGGEGLVIMKAFEPYRPGERKAWMSLKLKKQLGEIKVKVIDTLRLLKISHRRYTIRPMEILGFI